MMQEHPITPPPELVKQWATANGTVYKDLSVFCQNIANEAARWGADQELEACCVWLSREVKTFSATAHLEAQRRSDNLRTARRYKPPSLKEQALAALDDAVVRGDCIAVSEASPIIRRALESLPD